MQRQHRMANITCRIRKYRKSAQLSQLELARLVGLKSQGTLCEIEAGTKRPSARVAFACEIVFATPTRELFPSLYARSTRTVRKAAARLQGTLGEKRPAAREHLADVVRRLSHSGV